MTSSPTKVCAICGQAEATTVDHVPPRGIFPKPRPSDLITVPACFDYNNSASQFDERFSVYLSLHAGLDQPETRKLFETKTLRTVNHNQKLKRTILSEAEEVLLSTPTGIIFGKAHALNWDSEAHTKVIERIARGLYFHQYREVLGPDVIVDVMWFEQVGEKLGAMTAALPLHSVANGQFAYKTFRAEGIMPEWSIWVFEFYGRHWAGAVTRPNGFKPPGTPSAA